MPGNLPKILYEDDELLAVLKPAGVVVHPDSYHKENTLIEDILKERPEINGVGDNATRPGIVHRLDKDTSGVLLIAKKQEIFTYIKDLFKEGRIEKTYVALVAGSMKNNEGIINAPIARSTKHFEKRVVGGRRGVSREAATEYKVIERFSDYTLLEVYPKTGRTHQIRSHLAHIGFPVACDRLYGGKKYKCPKFLGRQFLHAKSVEFTLPRGTRLLIEAELPCDLNAALKELRR